MVIDYTAIGNRIARRRKSLNLTQAQVSETVDISVPYLSNIERAISIPSTEVIMRLALALDTTPDTFLVGTTHHENEGWRDVAQRLRGLTPGQLRLTAHFLDWVVEQDL